MAASGNQKNPNQSIVFFMEQKVTGIIGDVPHLGYPNPSCFSKHEAQLPLRC